MKLSGYASQMIKLGLGAWSVCYALAALLFSLRTFAPNPHQALLLCRSFLEAGPALAAAAVCAALICDLVQKKELS